MEVLKSVMNGTVATKADLVALRSKIKADLRALEVRLIKWFVATLVAVGAMNVAAVGILMAVLG